MLLIPILTIETQSKLNYYKVMRTMIIKKRKRLKNRFKSFGLILLVIAAIMAGLPACGVLKGPDSNQTKAIANDETIFYITRHGETEANVQGLLVGSCRIYTSC